MSESITYYYGYSPIGDVLVLALIIIFTVLIRLVYTRPRAELKILKCILICAAVAASTNLIRFELAISQKEHSLFILYSFRCVYFLLLFIILALYLKYIEDLLKLDDQKQKSFSKIAFIVVAVGFVLDLSDTLFQLGFYYEESQPNVGSNVIFAIEYCLLVGMIILSIKINGERIYKPLVQATVWTTAVSIAIMIIQDIFGQRSYTTATFIFPIFAVLYILHSNPFDPELGILNLEAFNEIVLDAKKRGKKMLLISYYLHEYDLPGKQYPEAIKKGIRRYITDYLKNAILFRISNGRMILMADISNNPKYENTLETMLKTFNRFYERYHQDYKIIVMQSTDNIMTSEEYTQFFEFLESQMNENEVYYSNDEDISKFGVHNYIVSQLADIHEKGDLSDPRVTVFCQPVYNVRTGKYDSAEALMRLTLDETGMVFPDKFIPIAEKHNYIHMLSMIIFSKTCHQVQELMSKGYNFERVSVNFSILDVRENDFCEKIIDVIKANHIPFEKIAIEVTESQNESDFNTIKEKFTILKEKGITLYLDDFGTGYSSFDRIIEIPFDIIKFDRFLVVESANSDKNKIMVSYLAHMFTDLNYAVLYEGIENEDDQTRCMSMFASYLQGYKYSKPIPIERLTEFFESA